MKIIVVSVQKLKISHRSHTASQAENAWRGNGVAFEPAATLHSPYSIVCKECPLSPKWRMLPPPNSKCGRIGSNKHTCHITFLRMISSAVTMRLNAIYPMHEGSEAFHSSIDTYPYFPCHTPLYSNTRLRMVLNCCSCHRTRGKCRTQVQLYSKICYRQNYKL